MSLFSIALIFLVLLIIIIVVLTKYSGRRIRQKPTAQRTCGQTGRFPRGLGPVVHHETHGEEKAESSHKNLGHQSTGARHEHGSCPVVGQETLGKENFTEKEHGQRSIGDKLGSGQSVRRATLGKKDTNSAEKKPGHRSIGECHRLDSGYVDHHETQGEENADSDDAHQSTGERHDHGSGPAVHQETSDGTITNSDDVNHSIGECHDANEKLANPSALSTEEELAPQPIGGCHKDDSDTVVHQQSSSDTNSDQDQQADQLTAEIRERELESSGERWATVDHESKDKIQEQRTECTTDVLPKPSNNFLDSLYVKWNTSAKNEKGRSQIYSKGEITHIDAAYDVLCIISIRVCKHRWIFIALVGQLRQFVGAMILRNAHCNYKKMYHRVVEPNVKSHENGNITIWNQSFNLQEDKLLSNNKQLYDIQVNLNQCVDDFDDETSQNDYSTICGKLLTFYYRNMCDNSLQRESVPWKCTTHALLD